LGIIRELGDWGNESWKRTIKDSHVLDIFQEESRRIIFLSRSLELFM